MDLSQKSPIECRRLQFTNCRFQGRMPEKINEVIFDEGYDLNGASFVGSYLQIVGFKRLSDEGKLVIVGANFSGSVLDVLWDEKDTNWNCS